MSTENLYKDKLGKLLEINDQVVTHHRNALVIGQVMKMTPKQVRVSVYTKNKHRKAVKILDPTAPKGYTWDHISTPITVLRPARDIIKIDDPDVLFYALQNS